MSRSNILNEIAAVAAVGTLIAILITLWVFKERQAYKEAVVTRCDYNVRVKAISEHGYVKLTFRQHGSEQWEMDYETKFGNPYYAHINASAISACAALKEVESSLAVLNLGAPK